MSLLTVQDLHIDFATEGMTLQAVRGASFTVEEGEILGVVGESGSGKSVTAHSIMRLLAANGQISKGSILFRDREVRDLTKEELRQFRGSTVSMIFQEPGRSFDPIYTIGKSLAETLRAHNPDISDEEARTRSIRLLEEVNVPNAERRLDNFPHQFSGGLLQRIMIAHALAGEPDLLIADEPTTALDVTIQAGIIQLLLDLRARRNVAIIFITHNLALISGFADRLVVMYSGMVLEEGPTDEVLQRPHHPYTAGLLASLVPFGTHHSDSTLPVLQGSPPDPLQPEPGCPFAPRCPLVQDQCRTAVPQFREEKAANVRYRCIEEGPKVWNSPGAEA